MEFCALIVVHGLQHIVVSDPPLHILIRVGVHSTDEAIPLSGDERADTRVFAGLLGAATDEEAGAVDLGGGLPAEQDLSLAGGRCEADQGDRGVGRAGGRVEEH